MARRREVTLRAYAGPMTRAGPLVAAVLLLAGCSERPEAPAEPADARLSASAAQTRGDIAAGNRFQVRLENVGATPTKVTSVQLLSPGFEQVAAAPADADYAPGAVINLPALYGAAVCTSGVEPLRVRVSLTTDDGPREVTVPLDSSDGLMERLHGKACALQELARQVGVTLGPLRPGVSGADGAPTLEGVLRIERRDSDETIAVDASAGSVLFDVVVTPGELAGGQPAVQLPVSITSQTCSGHRLGESKQPHRFLLFLRVGEAESQATPIPVDEEHKARMYELIERACPVLTP
jgi:hypothetical protein